jgi:hypothetical protein
VAAQPVAPRAVLSSTELVSKLVMQLLLNNCIVLLFVVRYFLPFRPELLTAVKHVTSK